MLDFELESLISQQLVSRGISDQRVISAFRNVPRRAFVPEYLQHKTFVDIDLPIGLGQTISPPYITARMLQEMQIKATSRVLEIGTGSGYQTALLSVLAKDVFTVEIKPELAARARRMLVDEMGIDNVQFNVADGFQGWSDSAPFDAIVVNASAEDEMPWPLVGQLRVGARMVMPLGEKEQQLHILTRTELGEEVTIIDAAEFTSKLAPMQGEAEEL